jgi:DNA (cytosine-5)-methyltransferase 1
MRTQAEISAIMAKVKSTDTAPETKLKNALSAMGLRLIENAKDLPGKPDIVLPDYKIAIFVDGDYWHGNQWKLRGLTSLEEQFQHTSQKGYWIKKIEGNQLRDNKVSYDLLGSGWIVIRLWESQIETDLATCINRILEQINDTPANQIVSRLPEKTFLEFFAGIGLMRMGLEKYGWKTLFANDFDQEKIKMYKGHYVDDTTTLSSADIHLLPANDLPSATLATASFPCNDLSLAGARLGLNDGKQSSAFWGFIRIIKDLAEKRPPLILLENVVGFLTSKNGEDFNQALLTLNELGYYVDSFILDAANFVPQSRKRLFVVGVNKQLLNNINQGALLINNSDVRPAMLRNFILTHPEIQWNIRPLPDQPIPEHTLEGILEDLPDDSSFWWNEERAAYLLNQMSPKHRDIAEKMIQSPDWNYGTVFRRVRNSGSMAELRTDGIAGCLRTPRGGSGRQILFKAGKGQYQVRLLTPRECARLMGADNYQITVGLNQALFGFGDAVCVPAIGWIAEHYLNPLISEIIHEYPLAKKPLEG